MTLDCPSDCPYLLQAREHEKPRPAGDLNPSDLFLQIELNDQFMYEHEHLILGLSFALGKTMNRNTVRRIAGTRLNGILQVLRRRGLLAMTALRLVPIAPFLVEGVVAGAARVKFSDFMIGTALGMLPGTLTSTVFGHQLQVWLQDPSRINYWAIALVLLALGTATWLVRRWLFAAAPSSSQ